VAAALVSAVISLAVAEGGVRLLARRGAVPYRLFRTTENSAFWADVNRDFGVWHLPNASFHHVTACIDATYHSNSYGARDRERSRQSAGSRRTVVLGDSFVEGHGIADGLRMTDQLEQSTGIEHLNFGTGGAFGTIQELVLYRSMASSFDHSDVLLFVLPANDFTDNDPRQWPARRYRPYLRKRSDGADVYYTVKFEDRDLDPLSWRKQWINWLSNHLYVLNVVREIRDGWRGPSNRQTSQEIAASYDGFTDDGIDVMTEALRELGASAGARRVRVFIIPVQSDLDASVRSGRPFPLIERLKSAMGAVSNLRVVDLLPDFVEYAKDHRVSTSAFFQSCDFHWSALGNTVAAAAVRKHVDGEPF
jgi:hypothetical protein